MHTNNSPTAMKKQLLMILALAGAAQLAAADEEPWQLVDAQELRVINKGWDDTARPYTRIPAWLQDSVRPDL